MRRSRLYLGVCLAVLVPPAAGPAAPASPSPHLRLRLVPLSEGIAGEQWRREPKVVTEGRTVGLDLHRPKHPLLAHCCVDGRLFYVFYKTVEDAVGPQQYLIQRIRKTERTYASPTDQTPDVRVTYLVEAFKLRDGALKRADQHYGSFGINDCYRREVVKEYEIGFAEIDGIATGAAWPFARNVLYEPIQEYDPDRSIYDRVKFSASKQWSLRVAFDRDGSYSVESPELGFAAPTRLPEIATASSRLGEPLQDQEAPPRD